MKVCVNKVIAGDYKDSEIKLVDETLYSELYIKIKGSIIN